MISSINNVIQRSAAESFVNMSDEKVTRLATKTNKIANEKKYKKVSNTFNLLTNSLPVVAAASAFAITKNPKTALKQGAIWGALLGVPALVSAGNDKLKKATATPENKKGKGMSFGSEMLVTLTGYLGSVAAINALGKSAKVNKVVDNAVSKVKDAYNFVAGKAKVPESVSQKTGKLFQKAKDFVPNKVKTFATETIAKAKDSNILKTDMTNAKNVGKKVLRFAPEIVLGTAILGSLAFAVKNGQQILATKNKIKQEQFETAKDLISSYKAENEDLKAKLAEKSEQV